MRLSSRGVEVSGREMEEIEREERHCGALWWQIGPKSNADEDEISR